MAHRNEQKRNLPEGRIRRLSKVVGLTARVGGTYLAGKAQAITGNPPKTKVLVAKQVLETLGEMKGAAQKLGQTLSLGVGALPPELRDVLTKLFSQAAPLPFSVIERLVEDELGRTLSESFSSFDPVPFAAASLGQVHRAVLKTGETVAVKVQYPGIRKTLEDDLRNAALMVRGFGLGTNLFDSKAYLEEVTQSLLAELDYRLERDRLESFRGYLAPWEDLVVPRTFALCSSARVLCMEFLDGTTVHEWSTSVEPLAEDRSRVGAQLIRSVYGPFLRDRVIHADTHPGNYLVMPDKRLGVLDFGSVHSFSEGFWRCYRNTLTAALQNDRSQLLDFIRQGGFHIGLDDDKTRDLLSDIADIVSRPFAGTYDFGKCTMARDLRKLAGRRAYEFARVRPPPEGIFFFRALAGLTYNLKAVRAVGDYRPVFRELLAV